MKEFILLYIATAYLVYKEIKYLWNEKEYPKYHKNFNNRNKKTKKESKKKYTRTQVRIARKKTFIISEKSIYYLQWERFVHIENITETIRKENSKDNSKREDKTEDNRGDNQENIREDNGEEKNRENNKEKNGEDNNYENDENENREQIKRENAKWDCKWKWNYKWDNNEERENNNEETKLDSYGAFSYSWSYYSIESNSDARPSTKSASWGSIYFPQYSMMKGPFLCHECKEEFTNENKRIIHMENNHVYYCRYCWRIYSSAGGRKHHETFHH